MENVVDEDGWITVTKHGRNKGIPRTEAHEQKVTRKEKRKRKQKVRFPTHPNLCKKWEYKTNALQYLIYCMGS